MRQLSSIDLLSGVRLMPECVAALRIFAVKR
jgi:hypothetical protein